MAGWMRIEMSGVGYSDTRPLAGPCVATDSKSPCRMSNPVEYQSLDPIILLFAGASMVN